MNPIPADDRSADPAIRAELVERVRREIAAGTYDTPEKWALALDRLLDELEAD
jgi:negative regulator of flagellin synthesis FlgM